MKTLQTPAASRKDNDPVLRQALRLLQLEAELRQCGTETELLHHLVNDSRSILGFRQAFALRRRRGPLRVEAISSVSVIEPNAPVVRWIEAHAKDAVASGLDKVQDIAASGTTAPADYPFSHLLWVPFTAKTGRVYGGLILAAEKPWDDRRRQLADRLRQTYGHAWQALTRGRVAVRGPTADFSGAFITFNYTLTDTDGDTDTANVDITVDGVPDVAADAQDVQETIATRLNLLDNDSYKATDADGDTDTANVDLSVLASVEAIHDTVTTPEDTPVVLNPLSNDDPVGSSRHIDLY